MLLKSCLLVPTSVLLITYKFWVKRILQNLQKKQVISKHKTSLQIEFCASIKTKKKKKSHFELETSGYYCQNGILNFDLQYIWNEGLISCIAQWSLITVSRIIQDSFDSTCFLITVRKLSACQTKATLCPAVWTSHTAYTDTSSVSVLLPTKVLL